MTAAGAVFLCLGAVAVDGDTLRCASSPVAVRLVAINARELPPAPACRPGAPCPNMPARAAKEELARLISAGPVTCAPVGRRSWGRTVARCSAGGQDLSCALTTTGHAAPWPRFGTACE